MLNLAVLDENIYDVVQTNLKFAKDAYFATAYLGHQPLEKIQAAVEKLLEKGGRVEFLVGLNPGTQVKALKILLNWSGVKTYAAPPSNAGIFHVKLYLFQRDDAFRAVFGSSNFTARGLSQNTELNMHLTCSTQESVANQLNDVYINLRSRQDFRELDEKMIELYSDLNTFAAKQKIGKSSYEELRSYMKVSKQKIAWTRKDLRGWLEIVYNQLPENAFSNKEIYKHKQVFQEVFPNNKHIENKIRQQLQFLRDLGLVKQVRRGVWEKIGG